MFDLINEILTLEWDMFFKVANVGGKAPCQSDPETFAIMRGSQIFAWPDTLRQSYLDDLKRALRANRNLMTEKYAWMMETAFPKEFAGIVDRLPAIGDTALEMIEVIVAINLSWKEEMAERFPGLSSKGRPIYTKSDSVNETSFETYLRGELKTYSSETLKLYYDHTKARKKEGVNCVALALLEQARLYGYESLEKAEKATMPQ